MWKTLKVKPLSNTEKIFVDIVDEIVVCKWLKMKFFHKSTKSTWFITTKDNFINIMIVKHVWCRFL